MRSLNFKVILNLSGVLLLLNALFMFFSMFVSIYFKDQLTISFLISGSTIGILGALMVFLTKKSRKNITKREGYLIVFIGWLFLITSGCIPYFFAYFFLPEEDLIYNDFNLINILFETVSGYTATGTSIFDDPQNLPKSILFWRSTTNWIGGMGIIVLTIAILPFLGIGGRQLFLAEAPGIYADKIHPRITDTAKNLWILYVFLTIIFTICLYISGMNWFDATNHSMSAISTGGFSTKNDGVAFWYNNIPVQYILIILMFIGGTNFTLIYLMIKGQFKKVWKNEEFKWYLGLITGITFLITSTLFFFVYHDNSANYYNLEKLEHAFRSSLFHVISIISTTAFYIEDYSNWLSFIALIFFALFFIGGSAGSTSGGVTIIRHVILIKNCFAEFKRILHPNAIIPVRYNKKSIPQSVVFHVMAFFVLYMFIWIASTILFAFLNYGITMNLHNILTSLTITASNLGNVGNSFGEFGPGNSMNNLTDSAKILICTLMVLGRLELLTILILFTPYFWKNN